MPRYSNWEDGNEVAKRHRHSTPEEDYDYGAFGLALTQPPESPELPVTLPARDIAHELSERVAIISMGYDDIHAKLTRLERLDESSVNKQFSKSELICLLTSNCIQTCRESTRKSAIIAELLLAIKEKRIASSLAEAAEAQRKRARPSPVDDQETQPPDELDAGAPCAQTPPLAPTTSLGGAAAAAVPGGHHTHAIDVAASSTGAARAATLVAMHAAAAAVPPVPAPNKRRGPFPAVSCSADEASFVWRLLQGELSIGASLSSSAALRSVQTQTDALLTRLEPQAASQLQSQACLISSQPYCSSRDVDDLIVKVRKLLKVAPTRLSDDEIREHLGANGYHVLQTVESLRRI